MEARLLKRYLRRFVRRIVRAFAKGKILYILGIIAIIVFGYPLLNKTGLIDKIKQFVSNKPSVQAETIIEGEYDFSVHYIDVGQGDSTLIVCNGETLLIDAGENDYGNTVVKYLKSQNIQTLNYVIGTHPDSDHVGGLDTVVKNVECENIYLSPKFTDNKTFTDVLDAIEKTGNSYIIPNVYDTFMLGNAKVTFVGPAKTFEDNNNSSLAVLVEYEGKRFLFLGDTEKEGEQEILNQGIDIKADVLKVGHHGSRTSTTWNFINKINPQIAVISCGKRNPYGHPHKETLVTLQTLEIVTYRTDQVGTIVIAVKDGKFFASKSNSTNWVDGSGTEAKPYTGEYILNKKSMKFHMPFCEGAEKISENNKEISTQSRKTLIESGYDPCGYCNP